MRKILRLIRDVKEEANLPHNRLDPSNIYTLRIIKAYCALPESVKIYVFKNIMSQIDAYELLEKDELFIQRENIKIRSFMVKTFLLFVIGSLFAMAGIAILNDIANAKLINDFLNIIKIAVGA